MKLTYLHYYLKPRRTRTVTRLRCDLHDLVQRHVVASGASRTTPREGEDGESEFLLRTESQVERLYLYVCTRDQDIIKTINSQTYNCADIRDRLDNQEHVGFASYVFVGPDFLALASTLRGPRITTFVKLVSDMVKFHTKEEKVLHTEPLNAILSREQALRLNTVSNVTLTVDRSSEVFHELRGLFGRDSFEDTGSIEVMFRPAKGHSQSDLLGGVLDAIPENAPGLKKLVVRGKAALDDDLMDFYLTRQGRIKTEINRGTETQIVQQIAERCVNNDAVRQNIEAILKREHYENYEMSISGVADPGSDRGSPVCNS